MAGDGFFCLFFPDEQAATIRDIDYSRLRSSGIRAVVFDLDNTIARWGEDRLEDEVVELLENLIGEGFKVGILSNSRRSKIEDFVLDLPFPHIFNAGKPRRSGFREMLRELGVPPEEAAMVGDQLLTDVLGANRLDMYTIRVDPIDPSKEYRFTKLNRKFERALLALREGYERLSGRDGEAC